MPTGLQVFEYATSGLVLEVVVSELLKPLVDLFVLYSLRLADAFSSVELGDHHCCVCLFFLKFIYQIVVGWLFPTMIYGSYRILT